MPRKEEVLFCKIAISNGFVTQEQAQKVLGLCDKREEETGRRPMIGAVFTKYNLMQTPEVQKIYAAVEKRLGTSMAPKVTSAKGKGPGSKGARPARGSVVDRTAKPARAVDPQTLWMGIGAIVLFFGIVVALVIMVMTPSAAEKAKAQEAAKLAAAASGGGTSGGSSKVASVPVPGGGTGSAAVPSGAKRELPPDLQSQVNAIINDARSESGNPTMGLGSLRRMESQLRTQAYEAPQKLLDAIKEFEDLVKKEGVGEVPAPTEEPAAKTEEPAKAGEPAKTAETPAKTAEAPVPKTKPAEKKTEAETSKAAADETKSNDEELDSLLKDP
jgi:hypothetical protein